METLWFILVAFMLTAYVVLDGFDIGAGIVHHLVGKTSGERKLVISAIGPMWDGNEVWLLSAGGTLYFAFPVLYASSFSGFYLPLIMVLWLLILRAIGIELRHHIEHPMWHSAWDFVFSLASILLAIFFGAALGNVIRGVPLNAEGYFFEPLWTNFRVGTNNGVLDWYTVLCGVVALVALAIHGANYIAMKTEGEVNTRARKISRVIWFALVALTILSLIATIYVKPEVLNNYKTNPLGFIFPLLVLSGLAGMFICVRKGQDKFSFLSSATYLIGMLGGAAFALYPTILPASADAKYSLTIYNSAAPEYGLKVGIVWWTIGLSLAIFYFAFLFRTFKGKVKPEDGY
jgi:cytochrome d ubiquinol oxidase subunit II